MDVTSIYYAVPKTEPNWVTLTVGVNMDKSLDESKYTNNEVSARIDLHDPS